jgi:hypothetical protein
MRNVNHFSAERISGEACLVGGTVIVPRLRTRGRRVGHRSCAGNLPQAEIILNKIVWGRKEQTWKEEGGDAHQVQSPFCYGHRIEAVHEA